MGNAARYFAPVGTFGHKWYPEDIITGNPFGEHYFVDFDNGSDNATGKAVDQAFKTMGTAYAAVTTGNNDTIHARGGSAIEEDAMITWSKNKIHVVGYGTHGATDQEPRIIFSTAGISSDSAAVIKVTGWGNTFTNIRINSWGTHANNVTALWDAGEGTVYTNCQASKFTDLNVAGVSDVEARGDSTTWRNFRFGSDTLEKTADRAVLLIKGTGGSARMKNNVFEDCDFRTLTDTNTITHIDVYDNNSLAFMNVWKNCTFTTPIITSLSTVQLLNAVESSSGLAEGELLFVNPASNAASFCAGVADRVKVIGPMTGDASATMGIALLPD